MNKTIRILAALIVSTLAPKAFAATAITQVRLATSLGNINVTLLPAAAPKTVANFLGYVNSGAYDQSIIHRSVPGFVVQGGGYVFTDGIAAIPTGSTVAGEGGVSNIRGTLAMALSNGPNSASDQFFFNLSNNNSLLLDGTSDGGPFTVFARVSDDSSLAVMDSIASQPVVNAGAPFDSLPVVNFSGSTVAKQNVILVSSIDTVVATGSPDYSISASPAQLSIPAGTSATATLTVTPIAGYQGTVTLGCGALPTAGSCTFSPGTLTFAAGATAAQTATVTVNTKTAGAAATFGGSGTGSLTSLGGAGGLAGLAGFFGLACVAVVAMMRKRLPRLTLLGAGFLLAEAGCGSSNNTPAITPAGSYNAPVRVFDGSISHPLELAFVVQ
jgi:cyclophilin family peptidyl-prolyl cis-trans isomerase